MKELMVTDARVLNALRRKNLIDLPEELYRPHHMGAPAKNWGQRKRQGESNFFYVDEAARVEGVKPLTTGEWRLALVGKKFRLMKLKYVPGCFFPFVFERTDTHDGPIP